jgi:putative nucleotidyltransferase with HDIG domain
LVRPLNRPPGREWQDRAVHHGYRIVAILGIACLLPWLFPRETLPELDGLDEGTVAARDIIARVGFGVTKSDEQLESERRGAEGRIAPVFSLQHAAADTAAEGAHAFFGRLEDAAEQVRRTVAQDQPEEGEDPPPVDYSPIEEVLDEIGYRSPSPEQLAFLADSAQEESLHNAVETAFRALLDTLVASSPDLEEVFSRNVIIREAGSDRVLDKDAILVMGDFLDEAMASAPRGMSASGLQLYQSLLVTFFEPTLRLDMDEYRLDRERARASVVSEAGFVLENERIITANTLISAADKRKLEAYEDALIASGLAQRGTGFWRGMGVTLFGTILLGLLGAVVYFFRRTLYEDFRSFSVLFFLILLILAAAGLVAGTQSPAALIPIAFAGLLIGALFDSMLAVVVVAMLTGLLIGQPVFEGLSVPFITLAAGGTAALSIREINRRSQSWLLIAVITGAYLVSGVALLLLGEIVVMDLFETVLWGGVNATLSTALALGAGLPAAEIFTGRTTNQTLLELADLNRPMLRRLSREAPGTYAHSINVANLSEAACSAVGADALLTRVGAYYHDIGKMFRPQYFIENQPLGLNPHDRLLPSQSAEILREHVREGLRLADEARLPEVIKDFIREHHGTSTISYFLAKAREQEAELHLNPNDFCYPGPKPQSRETAVVMLADAVESASRTLSNPSPERIRALIDRLVETRIDEDELNECSLTLRDLDVVKSEFAHILTGLYHHRIDYPVDGAAQQVMPAAPFEQEQALASDTGPAPSLEPQQSALESGEPRVLKEWRPPGGKRRSRPTEAVDAGTDATESTDAELKATEAAGTRPERVEPPHDDPSDPSADADSVEDGQPNDTEQPSLHPLLGSTPPRRHPGG